MTAALFVVAAGVGAVARFLLSRRLNRPGRFPIGTFVVNVSGSFALGLLAGAGPEMLTVVGVGGLGAYTTFSTFAVESETLWNHGGPGRTLAYAIVSPVVCFAGAWLGLIVSGH